MPALDPTDHHAVVTWLGWVPRAEGIRSRPLDEMALGWEGFADDVHSGATRASCSRVLKQHPRGTEIRNVRQLSLVSAEEMAEVAAALGLDRLEPEWLGASVVLAGIPDFSHLPPSSRLQGESGVTLTIDMQNQPCRYPGDEIELAAPGHGKRFPTVAKGKRGVTAWVERPGRLKLGDRLRLHVPTQRVWQPQEAGALT